MQLDDLLKKKLSYFTEWDAERLKERLILRGIELEEFEEKYGLVFQPAVGFIDRDGRYYPGQRRRKKLRKRQREEEAELQE